MTSSPQVSTQPPASAVAPPSPSKRRGEAPSPQPGDVRDVSLLRYKGAFHLDLGEYAEVPGVYITQGSSDTLTIPARALRAGDRILTVDNQDVSDWTRRELIQLMRSLPSECQLRVVFEPAVGQGIIDILSVGS